MLTGSAAVINKSSGTCFMIGIDNSASGTSDLVDKGSGLCGGRYGIPFLLGGIPEIPRFHHS